MPRSIHGGRHELGQNFLNHQPTIDRLASLVAQTSGPILEIGAGDGALTRALALLQRPVTAIDIDEHRVRRLARTLPRVEVVCADALRYPLRAPVIVGNIPFHLTTPMLRRLLSEGSWRHALLVTQWEVARKRAGVGGGTMMTAQAAPWFEFALQGRVPAANFTPRPTVDGGILRIQRRSAPLVSPRDRAAYERFVRSVFIGRGGSMVRLVRQAGGFDRTAATLVLREAGVAQRSLPRDLAPVQWAAIWARVRG